MRRQVVLFLLMLMESICYGQIIADHTVVDKYDDIPQYYIDKVKEMWLVVAGESHSEGYRKGLMLLEEANPAYAVSVVESGIPEPYTKQNLRASRATWGNIASSNGWIYSYGEEDWFTNATAISRTKAGITYCNSNNLAIAAIGFGWCYDDTDGTPSSLADPVYGVRWYGVSNSGPEGSRCWGLDAGDNSLTGNTVCMDTYLSATQGYADYSAANGYSTKVFFTTGPVELYYTGEAGYQGYLKQEHIRNYVKANSSRILFDYADILCYDDDGSRSTTTWNGHVYPVITPTNLGSANVGHIGSEGAIRLAKAMWWMLARIIGWDGIVTKVEDTSEDSSEIWTEIKEGELKVHLPDGSFSGKSDIYGLDGSLKDSKYNDSDPVSFDTSNLSSGLYILVIRHSTGVESKKIILP